MRLSPERYRQVTRVALWLLGFIIVTGALVRLTGSGLGCSDWPTCEDDQLVAEVGDWHAMVEFVNRAITGLVSVAVVAAVLGSMFRVPRRPDLTRWSWGLVAGVFAQIIIGGLVVREHLPPSLVILHFLASMVLVWNAMVVHHHASIPDDAYAAGLSEADPTTSWQVRAMTLLATAVLVTGTLVTGAGPHSGSETEETKEALEAQGIDVSALDASELEVERLPFDVVDVARVHSVMVWLFLAATLYLLIRLRRQHLRPDLLAATQVLVAVIVLQGALGYVQYFGGVPAVLVAFHIVGAVAMWVAALKVHLNLRPRAHLSP